MLYKDLVDFANKLKRSFFIDNEFKKYADLDRALPIGHGQTISQPSLVLKMTFLLDLVQGKSSKVLEIGTGSGYQTALLAEFSGSVFTVERVKELSEEAQARLKQLGYSNIFYKVGDGSEGWIENAPYDRIMVTAAASKVPVELIDQLGAGGKMVIPVGPKHIQELQLITKDQDGKVHVQSNDMVSFVELKGKYGWE
ncbi:MAG: protein-L-isoaspartate(D-aspartate) O-methyltransferase [Clostridia bacterium]|nr:protein-L-isoaspartate(D-aspartate) O-methyltransferase [Clostridia bacterium]